MSAEVKVVYRMVIGGEEKELTEEQAISLRDSLLTLFPIPMGPGKKERPRISQLREVTRTMTGGWKYGNTTVSDMSYRESLNALDEQEFRNVDYLSEKSGISTDTVRKAMTVLIAQGKVKRRREGSKLTYKLKSVSYSPGERVEKIGTISQDLDLSTLQKDKELRRELKREH